MSLVRRRSPSPTDANDQPIAKKSKGEVEFPWPWFDSFPTGGRFIDKINSPILDICVGPTSRHFLVHKKVLTNSAVFFERMFDGEFAEAKDHSAQFPEDDDAAWEILIEWAYDRPLADMTPGDDEVDLDPHRVSEFITRVKLCCLAEKYGILLLHNLCIDSLADFILQESCTKPLLCWEVFRECFLSVYSQSAEGSGLRRLFCSYFCTMLACPQKICKSTYDPQQMLSLATEVPDLMSDFFRITHQNRTLMDPEPWNIDPCAFHIHPQPQNKECARALGGSSSFKWPAVESRLHYYMQDRFMLGQTSPSVTFLAYALGTKLETIVSAGQSLIDDGANLEWMDEGHHLKVITPKIFEARAKTKEKEDLSQG